MVAKKKNLGRPEAHVCATDSVGLPRKPWSAEPHKYKEAGLGLWRNTKRKKNDGLSDYHQDKQSLKGLKKTFWLYANILPGLRT